MRGAQWNLAPIFSEARHGETKPNRWVERSPKRRNLHRCHYLQKFRKYEKTTKTMESGVQRNPRHLHLVQNTSMIIAKKTQRFIRARRKNSKLWTQKRNDGINLWRKPIISQEKTFPIYKKEFSNDGSDKRNTMTQRLLSLNWKM